MKTEYFADTDTALVEFSDRPVAETREISSEIYVDLDANGEVVSVTIEHAGKQAAEGKPNFEEIAARVAKDFQAGKKGLSRSSR